LAKKVSSPEAQNLNSFFFLKERKEGKKKEKGKSKILIWLNEKNETLVCCMA
jgi:hypothetical protein